MGLQADVVKQGSGTTSSGNASRRFFGNPSLTAEITGVDETLIQRLAVILEVITCSANIDSSKFVVYAADTVKLAVSLYPWYNMPYGAQSFDARCRNYRMCVITSRSPFRGGTRMSK